jgi:hypothetical protein
MNRKLLLVALISIANSYSQTFLGGSSFGATSIDNPQMLHLDKDNNIFIGGLFSGSITLGSTTISHSGGSADGYLAKYNANGVAQWIKKFGGPADDVVRAVTSDASGNIYVTGYFQGNLFDANPDPDVTNILANPSPLISRDCYIVKLDPVGNFVWAKQVSNTTSSVNEDSYDIKCDSNGNVYVAGRFALADFDTSAVVNEIQSYGPNGNTDGFLLKLDSNGATQWVRQFGSTANDIITSISIDSSNNIYATGTFLGTVTAPADFDPSATNATNTLSKGNTDVFVVKIDPDGNYIMHKTFGGTAADNSVLIKGDASGNTYILGNYSSTVDFDPGAGTQNSTSLGLSDGFLLKLDATGTYLSHVVLGSTSTDQFNTIDIKDTRIMLSGNFGAAIDLDPGTNVVTAAHTGGTSDTFVLELNNSLAYINHYLFQSSGADNLSWVASINNVIIVVGSFQNTIDLDPTAGSLVSATSAGSSDVFLSRFTPVTLGNDSFEKESISFYPNPFTDKLNISSTVYSNYEVYSTTGALVKKGAIMNTELDMKGLSSGMYLLKVSNENTFKNYKIIKK